PIFLERYDMLKGLVPGGVFLLNTPYGPDNAWGHLPRVMQEQLIERQARFYVIDAIKVARDSGMGGHINTVMQVCFFAICGVLTKDEAIAAIKQSIKKTYGKRGDVIVAMNLRAVDSALEHLYEVKVPDHITSSIEMPPPVPAAAPKFVRDVLG